MAVDDWGTLVGGRSQGAGGLERFKTLDVLVARFGSYECFVRTWKNTLRVRRVRELNVEISLIHTSFQSSVVSYQSEKQGLGGRLFVNDQRLNQTPDSFAILR